MRRPEKQILDEDLMKTILNEAVICRIAMCKDNVPYVVPMNFAYRDNALYLHAAQKGKKMDILSENPCVCFEMEYKTEVTPAPTSCGWSMKYYSIIGRGTASFVTAGEDKTRALNLLMEKYPGENDLCYEDAILNKVAIIRIDISEMTGKSSGYPKPATCGTDHE